jgi:hypothetical protein
LPDTAVLLREATAGAVLIARGIAKHKKLNKNNNLTNFPLVKTCRADIRAWIGERESFGGKLKHDTNDAVSTPCHYR